VKGLRTLLICTRVVSEEEWAAFNRSFQAAASSIEDREHRLAVVAESIEMDLELVGATAIEDNLQEGVPATISSLVRAGIQVSKAGKRGQGGGVRWGQWWGVKLWWWSTCHQSRS